MINNKTMRARSFGEKVQQSLSEPREAYQNFVQKEDQDTSEYVESDIGLIDRDAYNNIFNGGNSTPFVRE